MNDPAKSRRPAFIFYAILCVLVFLLLVMLLALAYIPGAPGFVLWLFTPTVERTGG
ncbi:MULTISPECIES: hypothetical protein [unclassified Beijerinckia]|uniref:hypothetical protein n=1 Tax=unclassified Beijerinckia TaxID=2638183 RepID=UPI000895E45F|nr:MULTISPECIES: hypothetical protein [unclassified Beijerinckia]MDH7794006.1 hypothetical protein [Beijerinckia sp. GAS462]SEB51263.1 hypothetical protein SAMN05443249_0272 [Beijerinckia sp. 28-YEA-48]